MRQLSFGLIAAIAVASGSPATANTDAKNGTLLSSEPCHSNPVRSYEDYLQSVRAELDSEAAYARRENISMPTISEGRLVASLPARAEVEEHLAYQGFECRVITYASGGLKIGGLLWKIAPQVPFVTAGVIGLIGTAVFIMTVEERYAS